jgi:hypothetical protein
VTAFKPEQITKVFVLETALSCDSPERDSVNQRMFELLRCTTLCTLNSFCSPHQRFLLLRSLSVHVLSS